MKITRLQIHHFRNLVSIDLQPASCNVFLGDNGSGKTSLLESLYLLSRGKSFRHHQPKHYIEHGQPTATVFAQLSDPLSSSDAHLDTVGIEKAQDATTTLKLNGQTLVTQSPLTQRLPTLLLEPASFGHLEAGSQLRRELLDWLVFHSEPTFHQTWLTYQRLLKQRNTLIKTITAPHQLAVWQQQEIMAWDSQIAEYAHHIHQLREKTMAAWQPLFHQQISQFLPQYADKLQLRYQAGFDVSQGLLVILERRLASDIEHGYTRLGSHRADMNVMLTHTDDTAALRLPATDVLSRGEKKLLITALRLSQLPLLQAANKLPLVLLDDITAELDDNALDLLLDGLRQVTSQIFITSLSSSIVDKVQQLWGNELKVFEVKAGKIAEQASSKYQ